VGTCGKFDRAVLVMHDRGTGFGRMKKHRAADEAEERSSGDGWYPVPVACPTPLDRRFNLTIRDTMSHILNGTILDL
jgi:hypothetical protein